MPEVSVRVDGPLLHGRGPAVAAAFLRDATWEVATQGLADVQLILDQSIRTPTPYYETQVTVQRLGQDAVVHDRGIVYGPWLEGTSSRNQSTRFKGYAAFRRATQGLQAKVPQLLRPLAARYTNLLGGGGA